MNTINLTVSLPKSDTTDRWFTQLCDAYPHLNNPLLRRAVALARLTGSEHANKTGQSCLQQGIYMVQTLLKISADTQTLCAALLYHCVVLTDLSLADVGEQTDPTVAKLIAGVSKMQVLHTLPAHQKSYFGDSNFDNIRKMLLAMVNDIRVVLIKLAERIVLLRHLLCLTESEKIQEARLTQAIYAPLANRLGIGKLKSALEDSAFFHLHPKSYKQISAACLGTDAEREDYVLRVTDYLKKETEKIGFKDAKVTGRSKHIYSIYKKMMHKKVDFSQIYDVIAFRVLLPTVEACYTLLGHIHGLWHPIPTEFDDYIAQPKPNGYRSIHTALIGPDEKTIEIQIRTFDMHKEAERGVAAHWIYKEANPVKAGYENKIAWLRQLLDWQRKLQASACPGTQGLNHLLDAYIYVFTPKGDVVELAQGATPLDFAYHIHTSLGHRCRGAKIDGHIAPLIQPLQTGECVEIIATKAECPNRNWIIAGSGYLKTARAKSKVLQWFRAQSAQENYTTGKDLLDKGLKRLGMQSKTRNMTQVAKALCLRSKADLYIALGRGEITLDSVFQTIQKPLVPTLKAQESDVSSLKHAPKTHASDSEVFVDDSHNILTHIAACCNPVPGDPILGYITQRQGISVHHQNCINLQHISDITDQKERLIAVSWHQHTHQQHTVSLVIKAHDRHGLVRDITQLLMSGNISITQLDLSVDKKNRTVRINLSIEIPDLSHLGHILTRFMQIPSITDAKRA